MKVFKFLNGFALEVSDESSISYLETKTTAYAPIDMIKANFVLDNMKQCELDGVKYSNVIPMNMTVSDGDEVKVVLTTRFLSTEEVQAQEIAELQDAVVELADIVAEVVNNG